MAPPNTAPEASVQYLAVLFATTGLAACSMPPVARGELQNAWGSSVKWEKVGDLSSSLQSRLDSLR